MKKYLSLSDNSSLRSGTSLRGCITADYKTLVNKFGPPHCWDDYKSDAEWLLIFEDGTVAYIYNYKDGKNYLGSGGLPVEDITEWHVGGHNTRAYKLVEEALKGGSE